jgi:uncharacterized protein with von Willebrand factor type A (vWA) domain
MEKLCKEIINYKNYKLVKYMDYNLLYNNLIHIKYNRQNIIKSETQKCSNIHERLVIDLFKGHHFNEIVKNDNNQWIYNNQILKLKNINKSIKNNLNVCDNECYNNLDEGKYVIWQIAGSQSPPDCTLLNILDNQIKIFTIECKSCSGKIMWNDNIPRSNNSFYHIINNNTNKTALFQGGNKHVIHPETVSLVLEYENELKLLKNKYKQKFEALMIEKDNEGNIKNNQGISVYPRKNFIQNSKKNLKYDYTEYSDNIKNEWKNIFISEFKNFYQ